MLEVIGVIHKGQPNSSNEASDVDGFVATRVLKSQPQAKPPISTDKHMIPFDLTDRCVSTSCRFRSVIGARLTPHMMIRPIRV
ncbi:MAG: hypothetical protein AAFN80_16065, partial [Pseudomonadota bacterium]